MRTRREVLGDAHVDRAIERTSDFTADFQDFITRYAWGEIWTRPGLDRRMRSAITMTALIGRRARDELACTRARRSATGSPRTRSRRSCCRRAIYCGVPAANSAFAIAQRVIDAHARGEEAK